LHHFVDLLHILPNCLEDVVVRVCRQKGFDLQLVLQSQMHIFGLLTQFNIYINPVACVERFVESCEVFGIDSGT